MNLQNFFEIMMMTLLVYVKIATSQGYQNYLLLLSAGMGSNQITLFCVNLHKKVKVIHTLLLLVNESLFLCCPSIQIRLSQSYSIYVTHTFQSSLEKESQSAKCFLWHFSIILMSFTLLSSVTIAKEAAVVQVWQTQPILKWSYFIFLKYMMSQ